MPLMPIDSSNTKTFSTVRHSYNTRQRKPHKYNTRSMPSRVKHYDALRPNTTTKDTKSRPTRTTSVFPHTTCQLVTPASNVTSPAKKTQQNGKDYPLDCLLTITKNGNATVSPLIHQVYPSNELLSPSQPLGSTSSIIPSITKSSLTAETPITTNRSQVLLVSKPTVSSPKSLSEASSSIALKLSYAQKMRIAQNKANAKLLRAKALKHQIAANREAALLRYNHRFKQENDSIVEAPTAAPIEQSSLSQCIVCHNIVNPYLKRPTAGDTTNKVCNKCQEDIRFTQEE